MAKKKKVLAGLSNIHFAPFVGGTYQTPVPILFAEKIDNDLKNFLKILIEKGRITSISAIEATYKGLLNEKNNILEGYVISAVQMDNEKIKELETELSKKYNKNVTLENKVDKNVLGGVLVRLGNTEIDGTIRTRLNGLKNQLSQVI